MRDLYLTSSYNFKNTGVKFNTTNKELQWIYDECERLCLENKKPLGDVHYLSTFT